MWFILRLGKSPAAGVVYTGCALPLACALDHARGVTDCSGAGWHVL
jgi:hypothetical protein